ncbi:MAG: YciI family protein [Betaproteobacteria bacterium]|nr:YciI family protein [Betaproteobacteria bacterium]
MYYAIICEDQPGSLERRIANRPAHLQRLQVLQEEGRLLLAGPHPLIDHETPGSAGFSGSLIVAEFATREAALAWAADDPYTLAGVFVRVTVKPFKKVFPQ